MTRRQRRARRHPIAAAVAVLLGLVVLGVILRHSLGLVILAAIAAGGYAVGWNRRPAVRATALRGPAPVQPARPAATWPNTWPGPLDHSARLATLTAERDQLGAMVVDLRRQLADARASAEAARRSAEMAWDAAAERPPLHLVKPGDAGGQRAALLAQPLSGARPLGAR